MLRLLIILGSENSHLISYFSCHTGVEDTVQRESGPHNDHSAENNAAERALEHTTEIN